MAVRPYVEPQFIKARSGYLFVSIRRPGHDDTRSVVLLLPPFGEEMNKSRRLFTLQAQTLCEAGFAVAVFDWFGTGDSEGDFGRASIEHWKNDCEDVMSFLRAQEFTECTPLCVRFGALFLDHVLDISPLSINHAILWQPETSGAQALSQLIRVESAAARERDESGPSGSDMENALKSGNNVEVAGYDVSPDLFSQTGLLKLELLKTDKLRRIDWFSIAGSADAPIPPPAARHVQRWAENGLYARAKIIEGESFWSTKQLTVVPELVARTTAAVTSGAHQARVQR
ncbi:MAG: hydrolase 2, exosortase A system-associated [Gammaproteobacteria bacterium]